MSTPDSRAFAQLVSLACHDLRTPLATVSGFAKTLTRLEHVEDPVARYLTMIETASEQLASLLEELSVVARIEGGRWEPVIRELDSLELAREAIEPLGESVAVQGKGTLVGVEAESATRALYGLARCAVRHGGVQLLTVQVEGPALTLSPVPADAVPICLGENLRDLPAAVGVRAVRAIGGEVEASGEALVVRLPLAPAVS